MRLRVRVDGDLQVAAVLDLSGRYGDEGADLDGPLPHRRRRLAGIND